MRLASRPGRVEVALTRPRAGRRAFVGVPLMYTTSQIAAAVRRMAQFALEGEEGLDVLELFATGQVDVAAIVDGEFVYQIARAGAAEVR